MVEPDAYGEVVVDGVIDVGQTVLRHTILMAAPNVRRQGTSVERALWTEQGPSTVRYTPRDARTVEVRAWGPGARELVDEAAAVLGAHDRPEDFAPDHPLLRDLARRHPGLRMGRTGRVWEQLLPAIIGQLVTGAGASRSYQDVVRQFGEPAPLGLIAGPPPERLASLAPFHLVPCGIEAKRARTILSCAHHRKKLLRVQAMPADEAYAFLLKLPGIGPWTAGLVVGAAHGDPDAVPVGDYNLPHLVAYNLAGKRRSDDDEMLALLEPYRPHRGRVLRLLSLAGRHPPRRGPRSDVRNIR